MKDQKKTNEVNLYIEDMSSWITTKDGDSFYAVNKSVALDVIQRIVAHSKDSINQVLEEAIEKINKDVDYWKSFIDGTNNFYEKEYGRGNLNTLNEYCKFLTQTKKWIRNT